MDQHGQGERRARRPLLLTFARQQPADDLDYCYDPAQRLNITVRDGLAVVATARGRARLKTLGVAAED
jgi:hypothetical protein